MSLENLWKQIEHWLAEQISTSIWDQVYEQTSARTWEQVAQLKYQIDDAILFLRRTQIER